MNPRKLIFFLFCFQCAMSCFGQTSFYIAGATGDLVLVDIENCSSQVLCNSQIDLFDIAMTPNQLLYSTDGKKVFLIDQTTCANTLITPIPVTDSDYNGGEWINSLVAYGNDFLLSVSGSGNLFKIDVTNGSSISLGSVNYGSAGDLTWYKGKLLLVSNTAQLIEIVLDLNCTYIKSVKVIGDLETEWHSIYGAITIGSADCQEDNLRVLAFENNDVYVVNPMDASLELICDSAFTFVAGGATSFSETNFQEYSSEFIMPNVFTPNNDGVNDFFIPKEIIGVESMSIQILNRWGQTIFNSDVPNFSWNGSDARTDKPCEEGVYFYTLNYHDYCGGEYSTHGHIRLIR